MKKTIAPLLSLLIGLSLGLYGAKYFFKKTPSFKIPESNQAPSNPNVFKHHLINPFIDCIEAYHLDMRELELFKPQLSAYINKAIKTHPDLHISYYFRDLNNGMWIGINEKEVFSPASLMKVPVMLAVLKEAEKNPSLLHERIQYKKQQFLNVDEEVGFPKQDGAFYTVEEYLQQMIEYSDNASTILLIEKVTPEKVSETQAAINLSSDGITDPNANFVQVNRYAGIFRILFNASYLNKDLSEKALQLLSQSTYNKGIREAIPGKYNVAHKYGERDFYDEKGKRQTLQLHHFGIVFYTGKPFLIGIMTRGANKEVKEKIIYDLTKITYDEINKQLQ